MRTTISTAAVLCAAAVCGGEAHHWNLFTGETPPAATPVSLNVFDSSSEPHPGVSLNLFAAVVPEDSRPIAYAYRPESECPRCIELAAREAELPVRLVWRTREDFPRERYPVVHWQAPSGWRYQFAATAAGLTAEMARRSQIPPRVGNQPSTPTFPTGGRWRSSPRCTRDGCRRAGDAGLPMTLPPRGYEWNGGR